MPNLKKIDNLAASLVHDLRNPLTAVYGCSEMLLEGKLDPATAQRVTVTIHRAARRMQELLSGLADLTAGSAETTEVCNLRSLVLGAWEAANLMDAGRIEMFLDIAPWIEVPVARARMERVFVNLIVNAREALHKGGGLWISATESANTVHIEVEDNGPGIPAEIRSRLFEPFVTARKSGGTGLGLALSRQAVRDHGGDLFVEAADGARFVMSLPKRFPAVATGGDNEQGRFPKLGDYKTAMSKHDTAVLRSRATERPEPPLSVAGAVR